MTVSGSAFDLVLRGGRVIDERNGLDGRFDVAVKAGKIAAVAADIDPAGAAVRPASSISIPTSTTRRRR
jgi:dihydroorotase